MNCFIINDIVCARLCKEPNSFDCVVEWCGCSFSYIKSPLIMLLSGVAAPTHTSNHLWLCCWVVWLLLLIHQITFNYVVEWCGCSYSYIKSPSIVLLSGVAAPTHTSNHLRLCCWVMWLLLLITSNHLQWLLSGVAAPTHTSNHLWLCCWVMWLLLLIHQITFDCVVEWCGCSYSYIKSPSIVLLSGVAAPTHTSNHLWLCCWVVWLLLLIHQITFNCVVEWCGCSYSYIKSPSIVLLSGVAAPSHYIKSPLTVFMRGAAAPTHTSNHLQLCCWVVWLLLLIHQITFNCVVEWCGCSYSYIKSPSIVFMRGAAAPTHTSNHLQLCCWVVWLLLLIHQITFDYVVEWCGCSYSYIKSPLIVLLSNVAAPTHTSNHLQLCCWVVWLLLLITSNHPWLCLWGVRLLLLIHQITFNCAVEWCGCSYSYIKSPSIVLLSGVAAPTHTSNHLQLCCWVVWLLLLIHQITFDYVVEWCGCSDSYIKSPSIVLLSDVAAPTHTSNHLSTNTLLHPQFW